MSQYEDVELDPPLVNEISASVPNEDKYYQQLKRILRNNPNKKQWVIKEVLKQDEDGKIKFSSGVNMDERKDKVQKLDPSLEATTVKKMRPSDVEKIFKEHMTEEKWIEFITESIDT